MSLILPYVDCFLPLPDKNGPVHWAGRVITTAKLAEKYPRTGAVVTAAQVGWTAGNQLGGSETVGNALGMDCTIHQAVIDYYTDKFYQWFFK